MEQPTYSASIDRLIRCLCELPGIGRRSAERIAFHLVRQSPQQVQALIDSLDAMNRTVVACSICHNAAESDPCAICGDPQRDAGLILVVEEPKDVLRFESTGMYRGRYHVLMGRLAPLDGVDAGDLNIDSLLARIAAGGVREVILGTSPTLEGDGTALYLGNALQNAGVTVTRLARGLPAGYGLEQASKSVLSDALQGRQSL